MQIVKRSLTLPLRSLGFNSFWSPSNHFLENLLFQPLCFAKWQEACEKSSKILKKGEKHKEKTFFNLSVFLFNYMQLNFHEIRRGRSI